jgi:DNA-binding NtrC family response regulator
LPQDGGSFIAGTHGAKGHTMTRIRNDNAAESQAAKPVVLVVEDEQNTRELLIQALGAKEMTCVGAASVSEAMTALSEHDITLTVLDWGLDRSGAEVLRVARELYPLMPVVVISGLPFDVRTDAMVEQADAFVQKPFSVTILTRQVAQLLTRVRSASSCFLPQVPENILPLDELKQVYIQQAFDLLDQNVSLTAQRLGVHRQTVSAVLKKAHSLEPALPSADPRSRLAQHLRCSPSHV